MANRQSLAVGVGIVTTLGLMGAAPSWAQSLPTNAPSSSPVVDPNAGFNTTDSNENPFGGNTNSPFDIIHRAVLMNEMSLSDFSRQHQNRMSTEAANFRALQQEAIRQQQAGESTGPDAIPGVPSAGN